jgi:hypothetical protein
VKCFDAVFADFKTSFLAILKRQKSGTFPLIAVREVKTSQLYKDGYTAIFYLKTILLSFQNLKSISERVIY